MRSGARPKRLRALRFDHGREQDWLVDRRDAMRCANVIKCLGSEIGEGGMGGVDVVHVCHFVNVPFHARITKYACSFSLWLAV